MNQAESLLQIFPAAMRPMWEESVLHYDALQEIRLRAERPVLLLLDGREVYLNRQGKLCSDIRESYDISQQEMEEILQNICHYSIYAFEDEIRQGFLTVPGGHRIGMAGQVVMENEQRVRILKYITCMNIRISHQIMGAADGVLSYLYENGRFLNTLIISPPGCGKTTLLRDIVRQVSDGNRFGKGITVGVVDERSEIGGSFMGMVQNCIGIRTDLLDGCPKAVGMMMLIRSMAPGVVAIDEMGGEEDIRAMRKVASCGSNMLATVHGEGVRELKMRQHLRPLFEDKMFSRYIVLGKQAGKCVVQAVYDEELKECSK